MHFIFQVIGGVDFVATLNAGDGSAPVMGVSTFNDTSLGGYGERAVGVLGCRERG